MTLANLKKKYNHFLFLIKGEFTSADFDKEFGVGEDGGFNRMGKITADRRALIISDATKNLKSLLKKYPSLEVKEEQPKEEVEVKKNKSKVNK